MAGEIKCPSCKRMLAHDALKCQCGQAIGLARYVAVFPADLSMARMVDNDSTRRAARQPAPDQQLGGPDDLLNREGWRRTRPKSNDGRYLTPLRELPWTRHHAIADTEAVHDIVHIDASKGWERRVACCWAPPHVIEGTSIVSGIVTGADAPPSERWTRPKNSSAFVFYGSDDRSARRRVDYFRNNVEKPGHPSSTAKKSARSESWTVFNRVLYVIDPEPIDLSCWVLPDPTLAEADQSPGAVVAGRPAQPLWSRLPEVRNIPDKKLRMSLLTDMADLIIEATQAQNRGKRLRLRLVAVLNREDAPVKRGGSAKRFPFETPVALAEALTAEIRGIDLKTAQEQTMLIRRMLGIMRAIGFSRKTPSMY